MLAVNAGCEPSATVISTRAPVAAAVTERRRRPNFHSGSLVSSETNLACLGYRFSVPRIPAGVYEKSTIPCVKWTDYVTTGRVRFVNGVGAGIAATAGAMIDGMRGSLTLESNRSLGG